MIYAMNATTLGLASYTGLRQTDLVEHDGVLYGVRLDGLSEFVGDTDDGEEIDAHVVTGALGFNADLFMKSLSRVHLVAKNDGQLQVTLTAYNTQGEETLGPYQTNALQTSGLRGMLVRIPRGTPGTHWKVKVGNVAGGEFDLRGLAVDVQQTRMIW
jgi:hypothetical protein